MTHHICEICETSFATASILKRHIKERHSANERYACPQCVKTFARKSNLDRHALVHSKKAKLDVENPTCGVCERVCKNRQLLVKHLQTHEKDTLIPGILGCDKNQDRAKPRTMMSLNEEQTLKEMRIKNQPQWLCVTKLPLDYSDEQFRMLVQAYGVVGRCLLMKTIMTGKSKGYGFVQYTGWRVEEISLRAKVALNKMQLLNGLNLVCGWARFDLADIETPLPLHSKCLYVDCLPKYFCDMDEFRKIFSSTVRPLFCQIAFSNACLKDWSVVEDIDRDDAETIHTKTACPQDWGVVEYSDPDDAETMRAKMDGYNLCGINIRVNYCIPGVPGYYIISRYAREPVCQHDPKEKSKGLLPEPTDETVMMQTAKLIFEASICKSQRDRNRLSLFRQQRSNETHSVCENGPVTTKLFTGTHRYSPYELPAEPNSSCLPFPPPANQTLPITHYAGAPLLIPPPSTPSTSPLFLFPPPTSPPLITPPQSPYDINPVWCERREPRLCTVMTPPTSPLEREPSPQETNPPGHIHEELPIESDKTYLRFPNDHQRNVQPF